MQQHNKVTDPDILAMLNAGGDPIKKRAETPKPTFIPGMPGYVMGPNGEAVPISNAPPPKQEKPKPNLPVGWEIGPNGVARRIPGLPLNSETTTPKISAKERADALAGYTSSRQLDDLVKQLEAQYKKGPGATHGMLQGIQDFFPTQDNKAFNSTANAARGIVGSALGFTGGQLNTEREAEKSVGPFLPQAGDYDNVILDKIQRLKDLSAKARERSISILGGVPDENGNVTPVSQSMEMPTDTGALLNEDTGAPQGDARRVPDPETGAQVSAFLRAGVSLDKINQYLDQRGKNPMSQDDYARAQAFHRQNPNLNVSMARAYSDVPLTTTQKAFDGIARSAPGSAAATFLNSTFGGVPTLLAGSEGNQALHTMRANNPNATLMGDVAGGFTGMIGAGLGMRALGQAGRVGQFVAGTPGRAALTGDLAYGGLYGASESPDNRALGAALGAGAAGAGNAVGRFVVAPALRLGGHALGMAPAKPAIAERAIMDGADALDAARNNLQDAARLRLPYGLADADPKLRYVAGSAARINPDVRAMAETSLNPRALGQADRAVAGIDQHLAPRVNIAETASNIKSQAQAASKPFYDQAMAAPAPEDPILSDLLRAPIAERGLRDAYDIGLNNGVSPAEISMAIGEGGHPVLNANPNWRTLQLLKMGVDSQLEKNRGITGKLNLDDPATRAADDWRKRYVTRLGDLNPDYASGNAAYAQEIGKRTALNRGAALGPMTPDQVGAAVSGTPDANLPFLRKGYASTLGDVVERARFNANPYDTIYGSPAAQQKIGTVFPDGAPSFKRLADLERDMSTTRGEVLGGSPTQQRQIADSQFMDKASPFIEMGASLATGSPPSAAFASGIKSKMKDVAQWGIGKKAQAKAATLGDLLLKQDPQGALAMLDEFAQRQAAWKNYVNQSRLIGVNLAAPMVFTGAAASSRP